MRKTVSELDQGEMSCMAVASSVQNVVEVAEHAQAPREVTWAAESQRSCRHDTLSIAKHGCHVKL